MIHRRTGRKLKRTASHRKATLSNLSASLIKNKKIQTTLAKAKELRRFVEPLVTKAKKAYSAKETKPEYSVHLRRVANSFLNDRGAVKSLFDEIAPKVADRPGGYTRVLKMGRRLGDAAEMALIEFVDYNLEQSEQKPKEKASAESETKTDSKKKSTGAKKQMKKSKASKRTPKQKKTKETTESQ
jgi:large subunit ribosomal protein L17